MEERKWQTGPVLNIFKKHSELLYNIMAEMRL